MALRFAFALALLAISLLVAGCDENRAPQDPITPPPPQARALASEPQSPQKVQWRPRSTR
jgi:hypothetical protein